jgi:hypothetical protein
MVQAVDFLVPRASWIRLDVLPFIFAYGCIVAWVATASDVASSAAFWVATVATLGTHVAVVLCEVWFVPFRASIQYSKVSIVSCNRSV